MATLCLQDSSPTAESEAFLPPSSAAQDLAASPALECLGFRRYLREEPAKAAPEDQLAKEMTHDLEMNFNKIAPCAAVGAVLTKKG